MKSLALYIHIPFCKSKCYYCDFLSFSQRDNFIDEYIECLIKEIGLYSNILKDYAIETIFIGGGTPSYINEKYILMILDNVNKKFNTSKLKEVTIEANPCTINKEKLKIYKKIGINRISLGVQSTDNNILKSIGRSHTKEDFYNSYDLIRNMGFENINVDIMFGLPKQKVKDVLKTLEKIVQMNIEHISFYSLIIEKGTKFNSWLEKGKLTLPDEVIEREMYHIGKKYLVNNGYKHYEISNFAKKNFQCKHNIYYWKVKPYVGLGLGAHSNINETRYWNCDNLGKYFGLLNKNKIPIEGKEKINKEMEMAEYLMLGLRLIDGVSKKEFFERFNVKVEEIYEKPLKKHEKNGLLAIDEEKIKLTNKGLDLANIVFIDLLPE